MENYLLNHSEIQDSVFSNDLREKLLGVINNNFFSNLRQRVVSIEGYRVFVKEKYSSISYFIELLENAEHLAEGISHDLATVFRENRLDELGYFAGEIRDEYRHETWRLRSLESLGVYEKDLQQNQLLPSTQKHGEIMVGLAKSKEPYEVIGALLFLELFVVYEMKNLITAFERDLPQLFPKEGGYSYDNMPFNTHEYWYGHALHDTWHYRAIEEALIEGFAKSERAGEYLASLQKGMSKVAEAKALLYSDALLEKMLEV